MLLRRHLNSQGSMTYLWLAAIAALIIVVGAIVLTRHSSQNTVHPNACAAKTFTAGSSGSCVSDLQRLTNWAAYGINQPGYTKISGIYDSSTTAAVKVFQKNFDLNPTGTITPAGWRLLCEQGNDAPNWWTLAAKNAGCPN